MERSRDGVAFKSIGLLDVYLNAATTEFTDNYPFTEGHYRISYSTGGKNYASQTLRVFAVKRGNLIMLPNPSRGKVRILLANMQLYDTDISIYDITGRIVFTKKINKGQHPELDISSLPSGSFVVQARQNGITYVKKLQKN